MFDELKNFGKVQRLQESIRENYDRMTAHEDYQKMVNVVMIQDGLSREDAHALVALILGHVHPHATKLYEMETSAGEHEAHFRIISKTYLRTILDAWERHYGPSFMMWLRNVTGLKV